MDKMIEEGDNVILFFFLTQGSCVILVDWFVP